MLAMSLTIACSRYIYNGFILHAHPVRGESHNRCNATREVATVVSRQDQFKQISKVIQCYFCTLKQHAKVMRGEA